MKTVHCAAVDLGATSGRIIVGTWSGRRLRTAEVHRFPNQFRSLGGCDYWDVPYLWGEVRKGLLLARERYPLLASVGVDTWAVDTALLNAAGRLVYPIHAYRDSRTAKLSARLQRNGLGRIYTLTGIPNNSYNTSLQLQETLQANPELPAVVSRCLFLSDYFNYLLSGKMVNEISICSHSQLLNVNGRDWSPEALKYFGVPRRWFGRPSLSPRLLGPVTGIPGFKGVKSVLVPGHDTACAYAAMPAAVDRSDLFLSSGTWSLLGFENDQPVLGMKSLEARISNERSGDGGYRPLKSCLGLWLLERLLLSFSTKPRTAVAWRRLVAAAGKEPCPKVLIDVTDAALFNPPNMRAAIEAQLFRNGGRAPKTLAGYFRLICESLGRGNAEAVRVLETESGRKFRRILIVGGGSKNRLLCQATADASGLPVVSLALEGSAVGNVAYQLIALGAVRSLSAFRRFLSDNLPQITYEPQV